jgi:transcriptional regulator with XRE-family HTH domain
MTADRGIRARATRAVEEPRTRLGETLRAARRDAGLTQAALAAQAGLTQQYVARIEAGQINPTLVTIAAIARALGTNMSDLLDHPSSA